MKKVLAYICILIGVGVIATSVSVGTLTKIWEWNKTHAKNDKWYGKHNSDWGDLTNMAYLDRVPKFQEGYDYVFNRLPDSVPQTLNLCIIGDSYTADFPGYIFKHAKNYQHFKNVRPFTYTPDPNENNVLIIEITERFVQGILRNRDFFDLTRRKDYVPTGGDGKKSLSAVVNKNLEYLLFDYNFINNVKKLKAEMNYYLFHRASGNVSISDDGDYLFFRPTVASKGIYSAYAAVPDTQMNYIVNTLNSLYNNYKKQGYKEVFFSVIPNPATILQPEGYNEFIPKLQGRADLKMPCIDIYSLYKKHPAPATLYRVGDTHWNNAGMQLWLGLVNEQLSRLHTM